MPEKTIVFLLTKIASLGAEPDNCKKQKATTLISLAIQLKNKIKYIFTRRYFVVASSKHPKAFYDDQEIITTHYWMRGCARIQKPGTNRTRHYRMAAEYHSYRLRRHYIKRAARAVQCQLRIREHQLHPGIRHRSMAYRPKYPICTKCSV